VMRVFDPARHKLAGEQPADRRWRRIEAPLVEFGSELTVDMLESHAGTDGLVAPPQLLAAADLAMYEAKDSGRDRVVTFSPESESQAERRSR